MKNDTHLYNIYSIKWYDVCYLKGAFDITLKSKTNVFNHVNKVCSL